MENLLLAGTHKLILSVLALKRQECQAQTYALVLFYDARLKTLDMFVTMPKGSTLHVGQNRTGN
jgi:hypothetical protein